jgi:hypothetical protein
MKDKGPWVVVIGHHSSLGFDVAIYLKKVVSYNKHMMTSTLITELAHHYKDESNAQHAAQEFCGFVTREIA